jgi:hypothetical protein
MKVIKGLSWKNKNLTSMVDKNIGTEKFRVKQLFFVGNKY